MLPSPMLASPGRPPSDDPTPLWAAEFKWDGFRVIAGLHGRHVRLMTRHGNDLTAAFPDVTSGLLEAGRGVDMVIDGEVVSTVAGVPRFDRIQRRLRTRRPSIALMGEAPAQMFVFDVLELSGVEVMGAAYLERRARLAELGLAGPGVMTPPFWLGEVTAQQMLDTAAATGLEGAVFKRVDSAYVPGIRSRRWIKVPVRRETAAVIVGAVRSTGRRGFGALVLAGHALDTGDLTYLGMAGTGFSHAEQQLLIARLGQLTIAESPLDVAPPQWLSRAASWVKPELVGRVAYRERTAGGLRHPVWKGLVASPASQVWLPT